MAQSVSAIFKQRLRELRHAKGWSGYQAAEKCGIGQKVFQHYESGIKKNPGLLTLEKIARAFDVTVPQLLSVPERDDSRKEKVSRSRPK
jgi:transcriptional regulator with XRE-family HTH domain